MAEYHPLDSESDFQQILTELAIGYFGGKPQLPQYEMRALAAEMLTSGMTRQDVANALSLPLSDIPTLFAAPQRLQ